MAKVYDSKAGLSGFPVVLEDPRVDRNELYFFGFLHDKASLSPVFNVCLNTVAAGTAAAQFSISSSPLLSGGSSQHFNNNNDLTTGNQNLRTSQLYLKKQTVHVGPQRSSFNSTSSTVNHAPDDNMWWTMDRTYEDGGILQFITDGTSKTLFLFSGDNRLVAQTVRARHMYGPLSDNQRLSDVPLTSLVNGSNGDSTSLINIHLVGVNNISKLVYGVGCQPDGNGYNGPHMAWKYIGPTWPSSVGTTGSSTTNLPVGSYAQFLGLSLLDNSPLFVVTQRNIAAGAPLSVQKVVWQTTTPTVTQMYTVSAAISASGTNAGGSRMAGSLHPATCSSWFTDPRVGAGTTKCWYYPYFDSNRNFHPLVYTWNQTNDSFSRETDITITGDLSSVHANMSGLYADSTSTSVYISWNMACHTFVSDGNRYVMFINIDGRDQYVGTPGPRTSVIYLVDPTNPKNLTYHSKITWPDTPKNFVFLNETQTLMGMFFQNVFKVYAWNNTSGWNETVSVNSLVTACGRDADSRIWYVQSSDSQAATQPELHILTPSLPITINIDPEFESYDYAGTPINSFINVSAYNASGNRIVASVKLVINGGSMTFSDSTTVKTITTLDDDDFQQNIIITGAGFSNITASVEI